jgi:hypothetical protein
MLLQLLLMDRVLQEVVLDMGPHLDRELVLAMQERVLETVPSQEELILLRM